MNSRMDPPGAKLLPPEAIVLTTVNKAAKRNMNIQFGM